jgi:hypothetical protein
MSKLFRYGIVIIVLLLAVGLFSGCGEFEETADEKQAAAQEVLTKEATAQTGMPNIVNFRERKMLKAILELRDQEGITTYTYTFSEQTGKLKFLGESIGYGIPYATQYTNPQKEAGEYASSRFALPQADPNGLYSPASADGTWILMKDPHSKAVKPVYVEPRIIVSPFKLPEG